MDPFLQDLRHGWRALRSSPGVSAVILIVLSLGIGVNTALFTIVDSVILRPLNYREPERLVYIWERSPDSERNRVSLPIWRDWASRTSSFEGMIAVERSGMVLTGFGRPERLAVGRVSAGFFGLLGVQPALGRGFSQGEDVPGATPVVVLSHAVWQRRFGSDPSLIGRALTLDDGRYIVVGILAQDFSFRPLFDAYTPLVAAAAEGSRNVRNLLVVGRVAAGVSIEQARSELEAVSAGIAQSHPESNRDWGVIVDPMHEYLARGPRADMPILMAAGFFVLLIGCANVAGLLMAKGASRTHEMALRSALGARRFRLVRQMLSESVVLSLAAGGGGLLIASWAVALIQRMIPPEVLPSSDPLAMGIRVLLFAALISLATAVVFGLWPAWAGSRADLQEVIRQAAGRTATGMMRNAGRVLVTVEVAFSVVLLAGSGLMVRTFARLSRVDGGLDPARLVLAQMTLPESRYGSAAKRAMFVRSVLERSEALPGTRASAVATALPFRGVPTMTVLRPKGGGGGESSGHSAQLIRVSEKYFDVVATGIRAGRGFNSRDGFGSAAVAVVSESLARKLAPEGGAVGVRADIMPPAGAAGAVVPVEIVGVCGDVNVGVKTDIWPAQLFLPYAQEPEADFTLLVRTAGDAAGVMQALPGAVWSIDPDQPVTEVGTLLALRDRALSIGRLVTGIMASFGALALILSVMGIYSLVSYSVTQRRREMAIRMALGAGPQAVVRMVLRQGAILMSVGLGIGCAGAFGLAVLLRGVLFGVSISDPVLFGGVPLLLTCVILAATYLPARRAASADLTSALRE